MPANAAETVKAQNIENNQQTNVNVGAPQITINTTETAQAIKQAAKATAHSAFKNELTLTNSGVDDPRQN